MSAGFSFVRPTEAQIQQAMINTGADYGSARSDLNIAAGVAAVDTVGDFADLKIVLKAIIRRLGDV